MIRTGSAFGVAIGEQIEEKRDGVRWAIVACDPTIGEFLIEHQLSDSSDAVQVWRSLDELDRNYRRMTASPQDAPSGGKCDCGHPWSDHSARSGIGAGCLHGWDSPSRLCCYCLHAAETASCERCGHHWSAHGPQMTTGRTCLGINCSCWERPPGAPSATAGAGQGCVQDQPGTSTPPADPKPLASAFHTLAGYVSADDMFDGLERRAEG